MPKILIAALVIAAVVVLAVVCWEVFVAAGATVLAPDRHSSKSARAKTAGMSVMKGATSAGKPAF